jgi:SagB-type dehydrogenase family enzyme
MAPPEEDIAGAFHRRTSMVVLPGMALPGPVATMPTPTSLAFPTGGPGDGAELALDQAILARRTGRAFDPQAHVTLEALGRVLALSLGRTSSDAQGAHRAVPSAGAAYPVDARVIVQRVRGLVPGVYDYNALEHRLRLCRPGLFPRELSCWTLDQPWMVHAPMVLALVGTLGRLQVRYAARGYRYMLFEAGHVAQNLCLLGASRGWCVQPAGGFMDRALDELLLLPAGTRTLYLLAAGPGDPHAASPAALR